VLPLVVDVFAQSMKVDGYRSAKNPNVRTRRRGRRGRRTAASLGRSGIHRSALAYGAAYCIVTPGLVPGAAGGGEWCGRSCSAFRRSA
jgi:hypothetical protein